MNEVTCCQTLAEIRVHGLALSAVVSRDTGIAETTAYQYACRAHAYHHLPFAGIPMAELKDCASHVALLSFRVICLLHVACDSKSFSFVRIGRSQSRCLIFADISEPARMRKGSETIPDDRCISQGLLTRKCRDDRIWRPPWLPNEKLSDAIPRIISVWTYLV